MLALLENTFMNTFELRQTIDDHLNQLSPHHLNLIAKLLASLTERESQAATQELLDIPGFWEVFERGQQQLVEGRVTSCEQLKRKYCGVEASAAMPLS